jgi:cytochrome c-type biogenesis protein CcmE
VKPKHRRFTFVVVGLALLAAAAALVLSASDEALVFFFSPTEIVEKPPAGDRRVRIGGLVEEGSVVVEAGVAKFRITDLQHTVAVSYAGLLPDLFREGQGVVAEGSLREGVFVADQVLAKHDETYMPPEVADALKKSGQWQHMRTQMQEAGQLPPADGATR